MTSAAALNLAAEVAHAHESTTLAAADHLNVSFSSGGLAFRVKRQPHALARVEARLSPLRQQITLTGDTPRPRTIAVRDSDDLRSRLAGLRSPSRRLRRQPEDIGGFAGAAIWTYLTLPLLLDRAEQLHRPPDAGGVRRLRITLPAILTGHGRVQTLHVGVDSLICRHGHRDRFRDLGTRGPGDHVLPDLRRRPIGTTRVVHPRLGRPLPAATLVWIHIHSVQVAQPA